MAKTLNSIALILSVIGTGLVWKYGLPSEVDEDGASILTFRLSEEETNNNKKKWRRYLNLNRTGLGLIMLGFFLQLLAVWVE